MKSQLIILIEILLLGLAFGASGYAQDGSQVDGAVKIKTHATLDNIIAEGGRVYLSSVDISSARITGRELDLTTTTTAGAVTAGKNAHVGLASFLLNNSTVDGIPNAVTLEAHVQDVTANENARVDIATVAINGSTISGDLAIEDNLYTKAGAISAGENAKIGLASVLLDNSQLNSLQVNTLKAEIGDLTVQGGGQAYISTLKLSGVTGGDMVFSVDTKIDGSLSVSEGGSLNVNSVVMEDMAVSGEMNLDFTTTVQGGIEVHGDGAEVIVGGVRLAVDQPQFQDSGDIHRPTAFDPDKNRHEDRQMNEAGISAPGISWSPSSDLASLVPRYGYYCGPGYGSSELPAKNESDGVCKGHDSFYSIAEDYTGSEKAEIILGADSILISDLARVKPDSLGETLYNNAAIPVFGYKIFFWDYPILAANKLNEAVRKQIKRVR